MHGVEGYRLLAGLDTQKENFVCASHILYELNSCEAGQYDLPRNDFIPLSFEDGLIPLVDFLVENDRAVLLKERFNHLRHHNRKKEAIKEVQKACKD